MNHQQPFFSTVNLRYKIIFFNILLVFTVMTIVTITTVERERALIQEHMNRKAETIGTVLNHTVSRYVVERNTVALNDIAVALTSNAIPDNDIITIQFFDNHNVRLGGGDLPLRGNGERPGLSVTKNVPQKILLPESKEQIGNLVIFFALDQVNAEEASIVRQNLLLTLALAILAALGAVALANLITRPLEHLVEATQKITRGELSTQIDVISRDEIGKLADSFNHMTFSLKANLDDLREKNRQLDRRVFELSTLHQAGRIINSVLDLDRLFELIVDTTIQVLGGVKRCSLMLADRERAEFVIKVTKGLDVELLPSNRRVSINEGVAGKVFQSKEPVLLNDLQEGTDTTRLIDNTPIVRSSLCVPLKHNDEVIGIISASNKISGEPFTNNDLNLMDTLATQTGVAIKNARLYQALDRKIFELATLHEVGKSLQSVLEIDKLLDLILDMTTRVLGGVKSSSLILFDEETRQLVVKVFKGTHKNLRNQTIKPGEGIAGKVFSSGEPLLINNMPTPRPEEAGNDPDAPLRSSLCVPLKTKDRTLGVLSVSDKLSGDAFDESDLEMLLTLASQTAIAINNARLYEDLEASYVAAVRALANSLDAKDAYTRGHSERVMIIAMEISKRMGLTPEEVKNIQIGALLHDIGKIGIAEAIINKPGKLTEEEYELIKTHPSRGAKIIEPVKFFKEKLPVIRYHHERYDGKGYPEGLKGEAIPLDARIVCVADTFDAMTSKRSYRAPLSLDQAVKELVRCSGTQFDPKVVAALLDLLQDPQMAERFMGGQV